jgi:Rrf2 family nitric oxide-sensitive transcriptional repressor
MQLTRFSDISLRLLTYLASAERASAGVPTARAIAEAFNVPYTHMVKVVHLLARAGWIVTTKGKGGGLRLAQPAESLRIGKILRCTEPSGAVIDCFTQPCPLRCDCQLKQALDEAYEGFFSFLDRYTLADMAEMPLLQSLVKISGAKGA